VSYINWAINVCPLLKPALSNVYEKISGKSQMHVKIFVSKAFNDDLQSCSGLSPMWRLHMVFKFLKPLIGLLIMLILLHMEMQIVLEWASISSNPAMDFSQPFPKDVIFYFEALTVLSIVQKPLHYS
jgi:hypothetical protein